LREVILIGKLLEQSIEIIQHHPIPSDFTVLIKIFFVYPIILIISGFRPFYSYPPITLHIRVPNQCSIPLSLVDLGVGLESFEMTVKVDGCEIGDAGETWDAFGLLPPALDSGHLGLERVDIHT
jgi:hypothetical protein